MTVTAKERQVASLDIVRQELLDEALALEEAFQEGEIRRRDYELARERIREELAVVFRRMREASDGAREEQSAG